MGIVTISRDAYSRGRQVAEKVSEKLGYKCIGAENIGGALNFQYVFRDDPVALKSWHQNTGAGRQQNFALFRAAFYEHMCRDNIVYFGTGGHVFLYEVPNVIKVRILADFNDRVMEKMRREALSSDEAQKRLSMDDENLRRWLDRPESIRGQDSGLYDIHLNMSKVGLETAVAVIVNMTWKADENARRIMVSKLEDLALAARVEACLLEAFDRVDAVARDGEVFIGIKDCTVPGETAELIIEKAMRMVSRIKGLHMAKIGVIQSADPVI